MDPMTLESASAREYKFPTAPFIERLRKDPKLKRSGYEVELPKWLDPDVRHVSNQRSHITHYNQ
jgi:hypothetical protein